MKLTLLTRHDAILYEPEGDSIIIRLDSQNPISKLNGKFLDKLIVPVEDFEDESQYTMSVEDAKDVFNFVKRYESVVDEIVVHCHYRQGRSPACIFVLQDYFNQNDYQKKDFPAYNKLVYRKLKEVFDTN